MIANQDVGYKVYMATEKTDDTERAINLGEIIHALQIAFTLMKEERDAAVEDLEEAHKNKQDDNERYIAELNRKQHEFQKHIKDLRHELVQAQKLREDDATAMKKLYDQQKARIAELEMQSNLRQPP